MSIDTRHLIRTAVLVLAIATSHAGAFEIKLTPAQLRFQDSCMRNHVPCLYQEQNFPTADQVHIAALEFLIVTNRSSLHKYNLLALQLRKSMALPHLDIAIDSVSIFNPKSAKWMEVNTVPACPYCISSEQTPTSFPKIIRIVSRYWYKPWRERFPTFSGKLARNHKGKQEIIVHSGPHVDVHAVVYHDGNADYRSTATSPGGKLDIQLDSSTAGVSGADYYVISPLQTWSDLASIYSAKEHALLVAPNKLPVAQGADNLEKVGNVVNYISSILWSYTAGSGGVFPYKNVDDLLTTRRTDCKGLVTLFQAALMKAGLSSRAVLLNVSGAKPLSLVMPSDWPNHVIVYIPAVKTYVDITYVMFGKAKWYASADIYSGYTALDVTTGKFLQLP